MVQPPSLIAAILGTIALLSSLGVVCAKKPVYAGLSFLLSLLSLSAIYMDLDAQFIAVMQILVYAGAILVIFMFVIVLFQDAYLYIERTAPKSSKALLLFGAVLFILSFALFFTSIARHPTIAEKPQHGFGYVETIGRELFIDFFFPFEATIPLFLIAIVGAVYIGRRDGEAKNG
jgi:NADH-quinone oxidoreductase subunit J